MDKNLKVPIIVTLIGIILHIIESVGDLFARDIYNVTFEAFGLEGISQIITFMIVFGAFISIVLAILFGYAYKTGIKKVHFIIILIISSLSFLLSTAMIGPVVVIVGSIIGIVKTKV